MFVVFATLGGAPGPALEEPEIKRLVRAARLGSREAARRLYDGYVARVYRAVRPLLSSDAEAEDATQDAFVDALGRLERYEARPGIRFVAWLVTLALNRARRRRARAAAAPPHPPDEVAAMREASAGTEGIEDVLLRRRALLDALAALPERDARILSLYYGAELTAEEVAHQVGVTAAGVRKICERRRRELATRLGLPEENGHA